DGPDLFHDLLGMTLVTRLDAEIAGDRGLADLDEVDGADVTARLADGRRDLAQHARLVLDLEAHGDAVTRARSVDHSPSRSATTMAVPTILARSEAGLVGRNRGLASRGPRLTRTFERRRESVRGATKRQETAVGVECDAVTTEEGVAEDPV